jgi:hypothetical protein
MKNNKNIWVGVGVAAVILVAFALGQGFNNSQGAASQQQAVSLDTQNQCASAATTFFARWKTDGSLSNSWAQSIIGSGGTPSYSNHYNAKLGKCIIRIDGLLNNTVDKDGSYYSIMFVYDVYESKILAYKNTPSKSDIGIPFCEFAGNQDICKNPDSFNAAVEAYMTN